jgi:phage terminase large subunit
MDNYQIGGGFLDNQFAINEQLLSKLEAFDIEEKDRQRRLEEAMELPQGEDRLEFRLSDVVSENFYDLFKQDYLKQPYRVFKGGRSSLKSSSISLKLVMNFLADDQANTVCFRKVGKYLSTSVYEQVKWAIYTLGVANEFTFMKSPLKIVHKATQTAFYFYGVDDPMKIKSHKIARGYVKDLWFEEAAEFESPEEIDTVTDTFIREDLPGDATVDIYFSYNPPKNPYIWINEWVEEKEKDTDYYIHHSDYEDVNIGGKNVLSEQFLIKVEKMKVTDEEYWRWMYKGEVTGLGDVVYNFSLFNVVKDLPANDKLLFADFTTDTGYSTSATTFLYIGYTAQRNVILLDTYYYSPRTKVVKKAPSDFSEDMWKFLLNNNSKWGINTDSYTIDSADGALRNEMFKSKGLVLTPARKKTKVKMIENVESLLVQDRVYVLDTPNNQVFLSEHKKYQWDEDTLQSDDPKVIKENDHTCDAFQYYVNNNLPKLGLKV